MKNLYITLCVISLMMLTGDSDSFMMFLIWHLVWFVVFVFSVYKLDGIEDGRDN